MGFPSEFVIQFACVFAMFLIWFISLIPVRKAQAQQDEGYDNSNPRDQYNRLPEWGKRAVGAVNNTFEGLVFFSIAVFTQAFSRMPFTGVPSEDDKNKYNRIRTAADIICIIYIVSRMVYLPLYWYNIPSARSLVWAIGLLCVISLFIISFI